MNKVEAGNLAPSLSREQSDPSSMRTLRNWLSLRFWRLLLAFLIALVLLAPGISAPFVKDAEPQSAQWIADIVDHGHWLVARDYYGFANPKPPLFYWLSATATNLSGGSLDEVRARAVSLIAAAILAAVVLGWTAATLGPATGWLAFFFLLGSYAFASRATTTLTDMLMTLLLFAAYCAIYPALDERPLRQRIAVAGIILGLAILTKGPVTLLLLVLAVAIFCLFVRRNPLPLVRLKWPWTVLALGLAISAAWYVPAYVWSGHARVEGTFTSENLGHFIPASIGGTGEAARPIYYILVRLLGGVLPLTPLLIAAFIMLASDEATPAARKPLLYQLAMAAAVVLLFSTASAKRDDYILPAIPPLAIVFASLFTATDNSTKRRVITTIIRDLVSAAIAIVALIVAAGGIALSIHGVRLGAALNLQSSDASYLTIIERGFSHQAAPFVALEMVYFAGAVVTLLGISRKQAVGTGVGLAIITLAGTLLWTSAIRPAEARSHTMAYFAREVRSLREVSPLYTTHLDPEFSWYYGSAVWPLPRALWRNGNPAAHPVFLIAKPSELARLAPPVKAALKTILRSDVLGRGSPPALYELPPAAH